MTDETIERVSRGVHSKDKLDGSMSYRAAIEETETFSMDRGAIEIAIKGS